MLIHDFINNKYAEDCAIVDNGRKFTYNDLAKFVKKFRNRLYTLGVREGDRVAIFSRNSAEFIFTYFATASLGAIIVPINFQLSLPETAYILKNSGAKVLLTYEPLALDDFFSEENKIPQFDVATFVEKDFEVDAPNLPADFDDNSPCAIIYTSGTTGNPKGAVLSHKNLVINTKQLEILKTKRGSKILCVLPMYHCYGWTCCVMQSIAFGGELHVMRFFKPKDLVEMISREKLNDLYAVPSIYRFITLFGERDSLKSVRYAMCSGTTLPQKIAQEFEEKFGIKLSEGYGLSEASPILTLTPKGEEREGSIGKIIPDEELKVVDENGNEVADGEPGELLARGGNVMLGYWQNPDATKETVDADGWLHTTDIVRKDSDGYFYIVNRIKEMIISMGENIYPREVEEVIYRFNGVKDAAVVGVPDKLRGQAGACFIVMEEGATMNLHDLKNFLKKNLALYKIPREFHELSEMPRTSTGKISKRTILENFKKNKEQ